MLLKNILYYYEHIIYTYKRIRTNEHCYYYIIYTYKQRVQTRAVYIIILYIIPVQTYTYKHS